MSNTRPKVLIIPLDWGLGHASRCIPLIHTLLSKGCTVELAATGAQKSILSEAFPNLQIIDFKGYDIRYSKKWLFFHLVLQTVKILKSIEKEHKALNGLVLSRKIDWVISDNRYGCYSGHVVSTFITHQLRVKLPTILSWAERLLQKRLYGYINRFNNCWVPDYTGQHLNLSGKLGHPSIKPAIPVWYIGWLSRFKNNGNKNDFQYECIIILSGPEPMRTAFEAELIAQLDTCSQKVVLVRGLPQGGVPLMLPGNIEVYNHLPAQALQQKIEASKYVVSRSGYSTLMDAFTLQKKCILVPTPGQTEQEYLAKWLQEQDMAICFQQQEFDLKEAIAVADNKVFKPTAQPNNEMLELAIENVLLTHFADSSTTIRTAQ